MIPGIPQALTRDNAKDKMPLYLKILPRPIQKFLLRYCTSPVILVFFIILFLVIIPLLLQDKIEQASNGINNIFNIDMRYKELISNLPKNNRWLDLSVQYRREALNDFTPYKTYNNTKCINRPIYHFEFVRLLGLDPYHDDLSEPHILIVGDKTDLGRSLVNSLEAQNIKYAHCGCQHSVDFSSPDTAIILEQINITRAIVTCPFSLAQYSTTDGFHPQRRDHAAYLRNMFRTFKSRSIPYVYAYSGPSDNEFDLIAQMFEGQTLRFPHLIGDYSKIANVAKQCKATNKAHVEIFPEEKVCGVTPDQVAEYLIRTETITKRPGIKTANVKSITEVLQSLQKALPNCKIDMINSPHQATARYLTHSTIELHSDGNSIDKYIEHLASLPEKPRNNGHIDDPYVSLCVVGRHDNFSNFFEQRTQNFIDSVALGLERFPLARVELVFVDYATPSDRSPLSETFTLPESLRGRVRFINVPESVHTQLQNKLNSTLGFFEYIVKNIGIRRSNGQFVLSTNPDNLFPSTLFQLIAEEDFNEGVFYRSVRWDTRDNTFKDITVHELTQLIAEPWRLRHVDVKKRCAVGDGRFVLIDSDQRLLDQAYPCGGGDFIMLSKKLWSVANGFDEAPANPNVDAVFISKMMKMIPGYARMFINPLNMHQKHAKKNVKRPAIVNHDVVMAEYACNGVSQKLGKQYDNYKWGLEGQDFEEVRF